MKDTVRRLRHDVLNQVNHIVGYAELLLDEPGNSGDVNETCAAICAVGKEVLAAIDGITESDSGRYQARLEGALVDPFERITMLARRHEATDEDPGRTLAKIAAAAQAGRDLLAGGRSAADRSARAPLPRPSLPQLRSDRGLVLVVDDDEANRDVLAQRLGRLGYLVAEAEDGRAALQLMSDEPVDLVLLDIDMPELDGYGVLEARQADPTLQSIPVLMISASADSASVVRCIRMGAEDHLPKPFDPVLLEARVGACLEKKRLRDQESALLATVQRQAEDLAALNETLEARVAAQVGELSRMSRLRRFLSPQLADLVVSEGRESVLASHRRDIAVLFVDLSGFTAFSEMAEPEDLMAVLREFHTELGALVGEFEATVGFFAGDGLMVFFNDPVPCDEPSGQAVRMAVAMRERLGLLAGDWQRRGHDLGFAIGVSCGYATLGEIGFEGRYDYGVIGSVVNLAARLCDRAERDQILISARVRRATDHVADATEVGAVTLKGFHAPVAAYLVTGLRQ